MGGYQYVCRAIEAPFYRTQSLPGGLLRSDVVEDDATVHRWRSADGSRSKYDELLRLTEKISRATAAGDLLRAAREPCSFWISSYC